MTKALRRRVGRALMAAALAVAAGLAFWLAAPQSADAQTGGTGWQQVSAGAFHTCALSPAGNISCWGSGGYGQTNVPVGTYRSVTASGFKTCAVSTAGARSCWGSVNSRVGTGSFHTCTVSSGTVTCSGSNVYGQTNAPTTGTYRQVTTGRFHSCAISTTGTISCWGSNVYGQANPPAPPASAPAPPPADAPTGGPGWQQLAAGAFHTCALSSTGTISCWGTNAYGQTDVPAGTYRSVTATGFRTCAVSTAGARSCWGSVNSRVGNNGFHTCRVSSGTVTCSGSNVYGQTNAPTTGTYRQVTTGRFHSCAISTAGTISCWGSNTYGQGTPPAPPASAPAPPAPAPPPPPTIGARHRDGYFPLSFGDATLGQLKASGAALTVEVTPAASVTGPAGRGSFAFQPGPAGGGAAASGLDLGALAALRDEVATPGDYDGAAHGSLALPSLPVYVRYAQSASSTLRQVVLKATLTPVTGGPQASSQTISVAPPSAPVASVAGMLRGDADQIADLGQTAELALGLRLAPALADGEAALTSTCLSASAAAPTGACPAAISLGSGSRLQITGPATFAGTSGAKLLESGLELRCERTPTRLGGTGIACFILHDHDGNTATAARAPSISIDDDAGRDISIDAQIVASAGASFYAQLMNADAAKPLYHDATGSYYPLASKYAGRHAVTVNCTLIGEVESAVSAPGPGETRVIERVRTQQCTTADGGTKTLVERTRHAVAAAN